MAIEFENMEAFVTSDLPALARNNAQFLSSLKTLVTSKRADLVNLRTAYADTITAVEALGNDPAYQVIKDRFAKYEARLTAMAAQMASIVSDLTARGL